ncbi:MAG: fumarate hydratase [Bacillota bacterium]
MRSISCAEVKEAVAKLCREVNYRLEKDILAALQEASEMEVSQTGREILQQLRLNAEIAREGEVPLCQDTGFAVVFLELGQNVHITGGYLYDAVNEGVKTGYQDGVLRKSIVGHPLTRENTGDNTPAVIHLKIIPGDSLKITVMAKGGGGENMSGIKMLNAFEGIEGVKKFVLDVVKAAGGNSCPPVIVGVGIGGTQEKAAFLAKEALLRPVGKRSEHPGVAELEEELLKEINNTGIGPQGLGGRITALSVNIETYPAHIDSLPVAVNINCHSHRQKSITL